MVQCVEHLCPEVHAKAFRHSNALSDEQTDVVHPESAFRIPWCIAGPAIGERRAASQASDIANAQSKCDVGTNLPAIGEEVGLAEQSWVIRSVAEVTSRSAGAGEIVNEICELAEYLAACIAGSVVQLATEGGRGELLGALVE